MNIKQLSLFSVLIIVFFIASFTFAGEATRDFNKIPVKGNVTMIDLGAKKCIPCKMMAPILEKLEKAYDGKADIVFIDVWENREQATRFGIRGIPTQIFYDKEGKEVYRHTGFIGEDDIKAQLKKMGIDLPEENKK